RAVVARRMFFIIVPLLGQKFCPIQLIRIENGSFSQSRFTFATKQRSLRAIDLKYDAKMSHSERRQFFAYMLFSSFYWPKHVNCTTKCQKSHWSLK
ncbi:MAG: hypothetical protein NWR06_04335, partial [Paracoccaceae bacterium]|nr:hypothetical protein [Paracoccaceae bacterium]